MFQMVKQALRTSSAFFFSIWAEGLSLFPVGTNTWMRNVPVPEAFRASCAPPALYIGLD